MEMQSLSPALNGDPVKLPPEAMREILEIPGSGTQRFTIHIVDSNANDRASTFRLFAEFGYHCEIYSTLAELINFQPTFGIALVRERKVDDTVAKAVEQAREAGLALTVVGCAENPSLDSVIAAMQAGAEHYFEMPFDRRKVEPALKRLVAINKAKQKSDELRAQALVKLRRLSARERQVVELLVDGLSNKTIARQLNISPRTVEIHRMKAMGKLGAQTASEAVRIWLVGTEAYKTAPRIVE